MKNNSLKGKTDPKLHVRKKVAGGATGAMLGAAVAGPLGAVVGGALGTMIGGAAEQGRSLEMPKRMSRRLKSTKVQARARRKVTATKRSIQPAGAKRKSAPGSRRTVTKKKK